MEKRNESQIKERRLRAMALAGERLERRLTRLQRTSYRLSWVRFAVFVAGLLATGFAYELFGLPAGALTFVLSAVLFGVAVYFHRRLERAIARHRFWRDLRATHIARANLDWDRMPPARPWTPRPEHPFEADLSLVGPRSLHQMLDTAVTYEGSERLRDWLSATVPDPTVSHSRQRLVRELVPLRRLRERLALGASLAAGEGEKRDWRARQLLDWLDRPAADPGLGRWLAVLGALALVDAVLFAAYWLGLLPPWWQATFFVYLGLTLYKSRSTGRAWDEVLSLQGALRQLRSVFRQLEEFSYRRSPALREHCLPFIDRAERPSAYLGRLTLFAAALGVQGNPLVYFFLNAVVPWEAFFAYRLERYKADIAPHAHAWLEVWFDLESLGSLANAAYLNPAYSFPEIVPVEALGEGEAVFSAEGLGHPLIRDEMKVSNDFEVPALGEVVLMSGSNMAGKSVFLKTVALALVMAYAGGAVSARQLRALPFRVFSSMAISDSVTDGFSYFYAEVRRLKALLDALEGEHRLPLLYCVDEIFRGTNNRERLIGARAYVRALAGKKGVGLIATHDLELTRLADDLPGVVNYHFRDSVVGDRMVFDYRLHPGPSPTTNALRLMRLQGLPVPAEEA